MVLHSFVSKETKVGLKLSSASVAADAEFGSSNSSRSAGQRAKELAEVCLMVYEKGGKGIHVPLAPEHPLVVVMKESLAVSANSSSANAAAVAAAEVHKGAQEVALALKDLIIKAQVSLCMWFTVRAGLH